MTYSVTPEETTTADEEMRATAFGLPNRRMKRRPSQPVYRQAPLTICGNLNLDMRATARAGEVRPLRIAASDLAVQD